ncbi:MAG TPA: hypothetical protein VMP01_28530 [Pirellulaceae bacterium]|nr:hypothetical protein [Pirellulaceae bacterium]
MIRLQCPCGKAYQLKNEMAGKKVKCPTCQGIMTVPLVAVLVETPTPAPATPAASAVLAPLDGLSPLSGGDPFAGLPPAPTLGPALGMANPGFAPPNPLASPANDHVAAGRNPTSPLVWIIGGISVAVVLGAVIMGVTLVAILTGPNNRPRGYVPPESLSRTEPTGTAPVAGSPGAPGGGAVLPASSLQDQLRAPTFTQDGQGRPVVGSQIGQWQLFTSQDGGYQINLPGKPQIVPQSLNTPNGPVTGSVAVVGSEASGMVVITHVDVPFDTAVVPIDKLTEVQIAMQGGKVVRSGDVTISGKPGKEFVADIAKAGFTGKALFRTLGAGGRVFTLAYLGQAGKFDEAKAAECLNSFALTREPPPPKTDGKSFNAGIPIARDVVWTMQESAQFHFRVEFPSPPKLMRDPSDQQKIEETWVCEVAGKGAFMASAIIAVIPESGLADAAGQRKQELIGRLGSPLHDTTSRQGAAQVSDLVFNHPQGMRTLVRLYVTGKTGYQVTWTGQPELAGSEEVNRSFNSFAITGGGAESSSSNAADASKAASPF